MKEVIFFILLFLLLLTACNKKVKPQKVILSPAEKMEQIAKSNFKSNYEITYNKSKTVACISKKIKTRPNDIFHTLNFILYHIEKDRILFKETHPRADGKWKSDDEFQVTLTPGRMGKVASSKNRPLIVYNVKTKQKRKI